MTLTEACVWGKWGSAVGGVPLEQGGGLWQGSWEPLGLGQVNASL